VSWGGGGLESCYIKLLHTDTHGNKNKVNKNFIKIK
jgi:hypothetical protein